MIGSAYRSAATQDQLFNRYVATAGYQEADKYSAHPGHSEHQTGLAVDISTTSQQCYLSECFIGTADGQWLAENAYKYGFTLRYPKGKELTTGYNFEPWHYRYVGIGLATALYQSGLTLDEAWPYMETALATLRSNRAVK
jgi:D-alanyl-D-alanine carboxypeptidase